jgi:hypothetical protein
VPFLALFLFLLWELPAMIAMSFHKLVCAATGGSFTAQYFGVWAYRGIGVFLVWPVLLAMFGLISLGGVLAVLAEMVLVAVVCVVIWARFGNGGS